MFIYNLIKCLRVRQWTKNILIFAALVFSNNAKNVQFLFICLLAFFIFSLVSGATYILNDIRDRDSDRGHPLKKHRPFASGYFSVSFGLTFFAILSAISIFLAFQLNINFGYTVLSYFLLQIIYTYYLKKIVIVDVFTISFGFLLRVIAGAFVIDVVISNWILVCTFLLALFLALSKRRHEITLLSDQAFEHRIILKEYSPYLLDQMIGVVSSATLVAYMIYTLSDATTEKFGNMVLTVPFVLYGIFRYLYLVHIKDKGGQPEEILLTDIPIQISIILYGLVVLGVIYI
ncbi:decaprenyl-phosphate phosphoribosyltransferase [Candidatus Latescibacterota bacterium]